MEDPGFYKDIYRSIVHSWGRFWAIFAIVALGAGFYAGLRGTAPDMRATADAYFDDTNMMDIRLLSAFGFSQEDVEAIRQVPGIEGIMAGHTADVLSVIEDKEQAIRVHSLPEDTSEENDDYINRPVLVEGRLPEKSGECVVGRNKAETGVKIGDTITVSGDDWEDSFKCKPLKWWAWWIHPIIYPFPWEAHPLERARSIYICISWMRIFNQEAITDLYLTVEGASEESTFSEAYEEKVQAVKDALKPLGEERDDIRYEEVTADSKKELEEGWAEYNDGKAEAESQLQGAEAKLTEGQAELEESKAKLEAGNWNMKKERPSGRRKRRNTRPHGKSMKTGKASGSRDTPNT